MNRDLDIVKQESFLYNSLYGKAKISQIRSLINAYLISCLFSHVKGIMSKGDSVCVNWGLYRPVIVTSSHCGDANEPKK